MDKFRVNLKKKLDKYIKLNGISYEYFNKTDGFKSLDEIRRNGSTTFKTLFKTSKFLGIDIRNLLMFSDYTHEFENSFDVFGEFFVFLANRAKKSRLSKNFSVKHIIDNFRKEIKFTTIYQFESCKSCISLDKFYGYLEALEITSDDFFLIGEKYKIKGNKIKNGISINDFNNRIYELEDIKARIVGSNIAINPNTFPTLHGFLKICKSLRISPKDFFDFDKKEFREDFKIIDVSNSANFIKQKLESKGVKVQRYIKLDSVFLFCDEHNLNIKDFFDVLSVEGNINQTHSDILYLNISVQVS